MLEHAEQLAHAADEQALLVHLHPCAGRGGEDDVVAALTVGPEPDEAAGAALLVLLPPPLLPQPATTSAITPAEASVARYLRVISDPP